MDQPVKRIATQSLMTGVQNPREGGRRFQLTPEVPLLTPIHTLWTKTIKKLELERGLTLNTRVALLLQRPWFGSQHPHSHL